MEIEWRGGRKPGDCERGAERDDQRRARPRELEGDAHERAD